MSKYKRKINDYMTLLSNEVNSSEGEIFIYGDIGKEFKDNITPRAIREALNEMGPVKTLNLHINSDGGSVNDGNAIIDVLDEYRRKNGTFINAYIEGIAASMGSGVAMVADKIYMASNALMMIHKPMAKVYGNAADINKSVIVLEQAEKTLIDNYMRHFNGSVQELEAFLLAETWFTAEEALQYGLCDEITRGIAIAASAKGYIINEQEFTALTNEAIAKLVPMAFAKPIPDVTENEDKGVDKVFDYDDDLKLFGISEQVFQNLGVSSETALIIAKTSANTVKPIEDVVITKQQMIDCLGGVETADTLLALAQAAMAVDTEAINKAKAYDKLVDNAIEEALKSGVRAKGESFNDSKWKKILAGLDYAEILDQQAEWEAEAKLVLNAGKHISQQADDVTSEPLINKDNYSFCK